ncbi:MAG TPA: amylo-alpha-1,6-glucosidase [Polyangiales bacterium]|nr:amylo-alpha-1,6-glucosidase [Polyangiales bacterium]
MADVRRIGWQRGDDVEALLSREWLITNGLGGYSAGTILGVPTRRYHGLLIAALPNPLGRTMLMNQLAERVVLPDGSEFQLGGYERSRGLELHAAEHLREFRLDEGLPVWVFEFGPFTVERRLLFAHRQNSLFAVYRLLSGEGTLGLMLQPTFHFRSHDAPVSTPPGPPYAVTANGERYEISAPGYPPLRLYLRAHEPEFVCRARCETQITYRVEAARGYDAGGEQWSLGYFRTQLGREHAVCLAVSCESWEDLTALPPLQLEQFEHERRARLLQLSGVGADDRVGCELALAADQFVISPRGRILGVMRAHARGQELRTIIAGYHWFTDWGRDTMISLEGLTLRTGRHDEARWILDMFAHYVRDGLIPNLFPEGSHQGLYHTADATLWFFHALDRYLHYTSDWQTLRELLPRMEEILDWHLRGTQFGIGVDPDDGLLRQGQQGYQLTWMDAKCDDWVVTPRRGKAVELNALWYNALCKLASWQELERGSNAARATRELAERAAASFNARFWNAERAYLFDVVDSEQGDDASLRPNQLFAISLPNPVLAPERWPAVLEACTRALLTPVGLRSLAPDHPDYHPNYHGDLRTRDAAYHQGTVWSWLIGPYVDAYLRVHPSGHRAARELLGGLVRHLDDACIGSVSEVFDAEAPFTARGCVAQAWGVAELLRAWVMTARPEFGVDQH